MKTTKDQILEIIESAAAAGHLKHYFLNKVKIDDENIFHRRAPITSSMEEMVESSKPDAIRFLDEALKTNSPPFKNYSSWYEEKPTFDGVWNTVPQFSGLVIADEFYTFLKGSDKFKNIYFTPDLLTDWLKDNCILWKNKKDPTKTSFTKQIVISESRPRAYLIKDLEVPIIKAGTEFNPDNASKTKLSTLTDGQLGDHHQAYSYGSKNMNSAYKEHFNNVNSKSEFNTDPETNF